MGSGQQIIRLNRGKSADGVIWPIMDSDLERCDREIQEVYSRPASDGHWLMLMGIADWETEKRLILAESSCDPSLK